MPFFGSSLNVGAMVEPLTSQMAEYLGVPSGLMIKQVARKSEAASAGLKAFDVILKVGPDAITTLADWERALHANQGKPVQVTVLRDKKQQIVTLQVDSKRHSELEFDNIFPAVDGTVLAQEIRDSFKGEECRIDQQQMEQLKQRMEEFRKNFKPEDFKIDPKQMDELKRQMEEMRKTLPEQFQLNKNQLDELMQQMKVIRTLPAIIKPLDQQQLDQLKRQMEELGFGNHA
jgi:hypothetical protein